MKSDLIRGINFHCIIRAIAPFNCLSIADFVKFCFFSSVTDSSSAMLHNHLCSPKVT